MTTSGLPSPSGTGDAVKRSMTPLASRRTTSAPTTGRWPRASSSTWTLTKAEAAKSYSLPEEAAQRHAGRNAQLRWDGIQPDQAGRRSAIGKWLQDRAERLARQVGAQAHDAGCPGRIDAEQLALAAAAGQRQRLPLHGHDGA